MTPFDDPVKCHIPHLNTRQELKSLEALFGKYDVDETDSSCFLNRLLKRFLLRGFIIFCDKRVIKQNYKIISLFKIERMKGLKKIIAYVNLMIELVLGKFIHFDTFLKFTKFLHHKSPKSDHLFVTEISELKSYIKSLLNGDQVHVYIYSWDHIYKSMFYSSWVAKYFVWNEEQATALSELHGISKDKIYVVGSTLFCDLHDYVKSPVAKQKICKDGSRLTALFALSTGTKILQREELDYFEKILQLNPNIDFLLRLYPFFDTSNVQRLLHYENFLGTDKKFFTRDYANGYGEERYHKYQIIDSCDYFLHFGTTLGVEAAFFNTRSILLYPCGQTNKKIRLFAEQSQLKWLRTISKNDDKAIRLPEFINSYELEKKTVTEHFPLRELDSIIMNIEGVIHADR